MKNRRYYRIIIEVVAILFGSLLIAVGANTLLIPADLLSGGVIGICMILFHFFDWSVGVQYFIYNIPLLILGYIHLGRKFVIYSVLAVVFDALFLQLIPIRLMWTDNIILNSIFGGAISFAGGAIMLRAGGSNGGLDILARVIAKHKNISIAKFGLMINLVIVTISAVIFDIQAAMFTIIALYVGSKTYEALLNIAERSSVIIITDKGTEVSAALNQAFHRGVTSWDALGAYSHTEKQVILCIIVNIQWSELCQTVQNIDPHAFISAMPAHKIIGNFKNTW
ncbi:YitT family protein [Brevibacillus humidisoli]|uniref:YitT family protein n=1 Tax=Brevibacillus humidisoli TaxID=2895522 RepID=UPI001E572C5C|nr:YitT family protein [Brevibacillus humidisoli]UFJ41169.1 YitT family protein [Brevibacillus humidisoli]